MVEEHRHTHTHTHRDFRAIYGRLKKKKKQTHAEGLEGVNTLSRGKKKASISDGSGIKKTSLLYKSGLLIKAFFLDNVLIVTVLVLTS